MQMRIVTQFKSGITINIDVGEKIYLFAVNLGISRGRSNTLICPIDCVFKKKRNF